MLPGSFYWEVNTAAEPNEQPQLSHMKGRKGGWNRAGEGSHWAANTIRNVRCPQRQKTDWRLEKKMSLLRKPPAGWVWRPICVNLAFGLKKQEDSEFKASPKSQNKNKIKSHLLNISDNFFLFIHLLIYFACVRWRKVVNIWEEN